MTGQRWYVTEDGKTVVLEGHPDARRLVAGEGDDLPEGYVVAKGGEKPEKHVRREPEPGEIVKDPPNAGGNPEPRPVDPDEDEEEPVVEKPKAPVKKAAPPANKQRAKSSDK